MATPFKEGERVQVVDRDATADDVKSGLFFDYYRGLTGTVQKVYKDDQAAVEIETESLSDPVAQRHLEVQETMKTKWLESLSDEARNRLTDKEKDFHLRYTILVSITDLTAPGKKPVAAAKPPSALPAAARLLEEAPRRRTSEEIAAAEEEYLKSRQRSGNA